MEYPYQYEHFTILFNILDILPNIGISFSMFEHGHLRHLV